MYQMFSLSRSVHAMQSLVDEPLSSRNTAGIHASELAEQMAREVDGGVVAAHAFIDDLTRRGLAIVVDGDGPATIAVLHDTHGQSKDVFADTVVGRATGAGVGRGSGSVVESNHAVAGRALGASAAIATTTTTSGSGGRSNSSNTGGAPSHRLGSRLGGAGELEE